jgi:DNA-binding PadR family transcriptional regulator
MYELMVLGRLAHHPMHGYLIAKIIGDMIGPYRRVQWGALYPVLARLEQEGYIRTMDDTANGDSRHRKVYAITEKGRQLLHDLLMDTTRHLGEYDTVFAHKVALYSYLTPEQRLYLSRHYAVYAQQHISHLANERGEMVDKDSALLSPDQVEDILTVMDHRIDYWKHEKAWAEQLIARVLVQEEV